MKAEVNYDAYWRRHPAEAERVERTAFFGRRYDYAVERCDWRALMALARWSRVFNFPILENRARRAAMQAIPSGEKDRLEVFRCC